jgi:hypothetical protein
MQMHVVPFRASSPQRSLSIKLPGLKPPSLMSMQLTQSSYNLNNNVNIFYNSINMDNFLNLYNLDRLMQLQNITANNIE